MTLKTATLCALVGMIINLTLGIILFVAKNVMEFRIDPKIHMAFWLIQLVLLNGSMILFLTVLYFKQKGFNEQ